MYKLLEWIDKDKLDWCSLSKNKAAIHLLEQYPEKIKWTYLSFNQCAIHLLEQHPEKINWHNFNNYLSTGERSGPETPIGGATSYPKRSFSVRKFD